MKKYWLVGTSALLALSLAACNGEKESEPATDDTSESASVDKSSEKADAEQTIKYLGESYTLPAKVDNIVAASLESMEDAAVLGIKPTGVLSIGNAIPTYLEKELEGAELIGDKREPNKEAILALDPDVILGSSKYTEEVAANLNKVQTMIPYSHISTNWKENLTLLSDLTGKESEASTVISDYEKKAADAKTTISENFKDKDILVLRIRGGAIYAYPADVYLNPVIYEDLGAPVPDVITQTKAQAELSLEALTKVNPDVIFLQFETSENPENPAALDDLMANPIFSKLDAAKNKKVFVNSVDPLAQGGTAWSKIKFLDVAIENLSK